MISTSTNNTPAIKKTQNERPLAKLFTSAAVTISFEAFGGGHYLEMLKILKQTSDDTYTIITRRMIGNKGIVGILDGFIPWGGLQACVKGGSFGYGHALCHKLLNRATFLEDYQREMLSGGGGGVVQGIIMSPTLLLKTRVMVCKYIARYILHMHCFCHRRIQDFVPPVVFCQPVCIHCVWEENSFELKEDSLDLQKLLFICFSFLKYYFFVFKIFFF